MFPNSQMPSPGDGGLEAHLRNLIVSNSNAGRPASGPSNLSSVPYAPERAMMQQPVPVPTGLVHQVSQDPVLPRAGSPNVGRKRLNQAQRRQMSSQTTISPDPDSYIPVTHISRGRGQGPSHYGNQPNVHHNQRFQPQSSPYHSHSGSHHSPWASQAQQFPQSQPTMIETSSYSESTERQQSPQTAASHQHHGQRGNRGQRGRGTFSSRGNHNNRQLYQPAEFGASTRGRSHGDSFETMMSQSSYLEQLAIEHVPKVIIQPGEAQAKESFRLLIDQACREAITEYEEQERPNDSFDSSSVKLFSFGSMSSGFATASSDMDLALFSSKSQPAPESSESAIPRILEKKLLSLGYGARLLTKTRVPIIKLCEKPTDKLMSELLAERENWEAGISGHTDDLEKGTDGQKNIEEPSQSTEQSKHESTPPPANITQAKGATFYEEQLSQLKQKDEQSLGEYFNNAKRTLGRLNGRDISIALPKLSTPAEATTLNDVCKAFILGLASIDLIDRLCTYESIRPLMDTKIPFTQRSLSAVWIQIEGERLAMGWKNRPMQELNIDFEHDCQKLIETWWGLQNEHGNSIEPVAYNRRLFLACEKLKRIDSLQLSFLKQISTEDPGFYQARAQKIFEAFKVTRDDPQYDNIIRVLTRQYINGVNNESIKQIMQSRSPSTPEEAFIEHRKLCLALDFEVALKSGTYFDESDRPYIERYISWLQKSNVSELDGHVKELDSLVNKIRTLPDPTLFTSKKSKDTHKDKIEFPKEGVGIQCDINFSAHLAMHNSLLLRCYCLSDPRVQPLVLFVKHWAKTRGINSSYRGTLSSYGYVLMVLHYLVNIAQPFVCPNLQLIHRDPSPHAHPAEIEAVSVCNGQDVRFWRNESEIKSLADRKMMNHNHDPLGLLLRGFFEYYAQSGPMTSVPNHGFDWGREVLSLRTPGGIVTKQSKGWVGAKTTIETTMRMNPQAATKETTKAADTGLEVSEVSKEPSAKKLFPIDSKATLAQSIEEVKEIRHRYLFAIEDPFEIDHNVARTVTHNGIVSIRDELRRAWRIIRNSGKPVQTEGLLDPYQEPVAGGGGLKATMDAIHGVADGIPGIDAGEK